MWRQRIHSFSLFSLLFWATKRNDTFHFGMWMLLYNVARMYIFLRVCMPERVCYCVQNMNMWNVDVAKYAISSRSSNNEPKQRQRQRQRQSTYRKHRNIHRTVDVLCEVIRECRQSAHVFFAYIPSVSQFELRRAESSLVCQLFSVYTHVFLSRCTFNACVVIHSGGSHSSSSSSIAITSLTIPYQTDDAWQIRYVQHLCKLSMSVRIDMGCMVELNWSRFNDHFGI